MLSKFVCDCLQLIHERGSEVQLQLVLPHQETEEHWGSL